MTARITLIDLPWIPVRRPGGTPELVGLRDALAGAHELERIEASGPLEQEALTRFLTTITALVVRHTGPDWDPRSDAAFPIAAVDAALAAVSEHLFLDHDITPFMQDPAPAERPKGAKAVLSLAFERPNGTVQAWHFRSQLTEASDGQVSWSRLAVLLIAFWYFAGENNLAIGNRKQNGALCGKAGNGLHYFWCGPSLAHTLLANTPRTWAQGTDLPAWADRDGRASGAVFAGAIGGPTPLWWASFSPNTVIVFVDPTTRLPAACVTGGGSRQPAGLPAPLTRAVKDARAKEIFAAQYPDGVDQDGVTLDPKAECTRIAAELSTADAPNKVLAAGLMDSLRKADTSGTLSGEKPPLLGSMSPGLAPLRNLALWYEGGAAVMLEQAKQGAVLAPGRRGWEWSLDFCHTRTKNPTALVYTAASWVSRTSEESAQYTLDPTAARAVLDAAKRVEAMSKILCQPLSKGSSLEELNKSWRDLRERFYTRADAACTAAIQAAEAGQALSPTVTEALREAALEAFDDIVAPFASPTLSVAIIQSRTRIQWELAKAANPLLSAPAKKKGTP